MLYLKQVREFFFQMHCIEDSFFFCLALNEQPVNATPTPPPPTNDNDNDNNDFESQREARRLLAQTRIEALEAAIANERRSLVDDLAKIDSQANRNCDASSSININ